MNIELNRLLGKTMFALLAAAFLLTGCATAVPAEQPAPPAAKKCKVGFFIDRGSAGSGNLLLARLLYYMPEVELEFLLGQDLRDNRLIRDKFDLLVIPGGDSGQQFTSMKEEGAEAVRKFVAGGGSYFGVCAGFHCALYKPARIGLLPFTHMKNGYGRKAPLVIDLSEKGAKVLDIPKGRYTVTYSEGPVAVPCKQPGTGWGEQLAVYVNSVSSISRPNFSFSGTPSIIHGQYGKGKVIATSFHPEYLAGTYPIAYGCFYAVTGIKTKAVFPVKCPRPIRVGFNTSGMCKQKALDFLEFDRQPDFDVNLTGIDNGLLEHIDVLVITPAAVKIVQSFLTNKKNAAMLEDFTRRGGKIFLADCFAGIAPKWNNVKVVPAGKSMVEAVRADFPVLASDKK